MKMKMMYSLIAKKIAKLSQLLLCMTLVTNKEINIKMLTPIRPLKAKSLAKLGLFPCYVRVTEPLCSSKAKLNDNELAKLNLLPCPVTVSYTHLTLPTTPYV